MKDNNVVQIHGKSYLTVAGRLQMAHDAMKKISITTEVVPVPDQVVVQATVITDKGTFTGISAANPSKMIEKQSPYEVAETSAVGRALGFAGFGSLESIATADEMVKSINQSNEDDERAASGTMGRVSATVNRAICTCGTTGRYHAIDCPARNA